MPVRPEACAQTTVPVASTILPLPGIGKLNRIFASWGSISPVCTHIPQWLMFMTVAVWSARRSPREIRQAAIDSMHTWWRELSRLLAAIAP
jgi:hypothetical protein